MPPPTTCSACRTRKVRCDGALPKCGPCAKARKPIECEYTTTSAVASTPKGEYLKKGAACGPCRRKKKKCDARRPFCSTCQTAGKQKDCLYEESVDRSITEVLVQHAHELERRLAVYENAGAFSKLFISDYGPPASHVEHSFASSSRLPDDPLYGIPLYNLPHAFEVFLERMNNPSPTADVRAFSNLHFPQGPEEFRETFLNHARQFGCMLSPAKMQAILIGDTSGHVVHPAFTFIAQLHGCLLWQVERHTSSLYDSIEQEQLQLLFGALETIDPVSEIQVRYILACYYLMKQKMGDGEAQLVMAAETVYRNKITFPVPPVPMSQYDSLIQEATEEQTEIINALAHLMYLDRCSAFIFRVSMRLDKSFDETFKAVADFYPLLSKTNLTYLRTRSLLLFMRTAELASQWATMGSMPFNPARPAWFDAYWPLLQEVTNHAANLDTEMLKMSMYQEEHHHTVALKFCLVVALSGKAHLHWLMHHSSPESAQRALDVVMEVVGITRTFKDPEFILLDPLLGICWSTVAQIVMEAMKGSSMPLNKGEIHWSSALETIDTSAKKLGYDIPFMDESLQVISHVINTVDVAG